MVAEVEVDQDAGDVKVKRLVVALDCGPVSNPDGLRNQIEGGALQGMSRALGEEVTWDDQRVTSIDWRTYQSLSLGYAAPVIESVLVDQPDAPADGAGETSITVVAAAHRQRDLRRHRRARAADPVHERTAESRAPRAVVVPAGAGPEAATR